MTTVANMIEFLSEGKNEIHAAFSFRVDLLKTLRLDREAALAFFKSCDPNAMCFFTRRVNETTIFFFPFQID